MARTGRKPSGATLAWATASNPSRAVRATVGMCFVWSLDVGQPRPIVPGRTYLVTRRVSQGTFRLRPNAKTNQALAYCLALALHKTGVVLHAAVVMSNHHHLVVSDPGGVLPDFLREFHRLTAKTLNALHGERENLWASQPCNVITLGEEQDIINKIAYVAANPVSAGLVRQPSHWPGLTIWRPRRVEVCRPSAYFDPDGQCPPALTLRAELPSTTEKANFMARLKRAVTARVAEACRALTRAHRTFLGRAAVLKERTQTRAQSPGPKGQRTPTVAAGNPSTRARLFALLADFRAAYRVARLAWRSGLRDVVFPFGTWAVRVFYGAATASAPSAPPGIRPPGPPGEGWESRSN